MIPQENFLPNRLKLYQFEITKITQKNTDIAIS